MINTRRLTSTWLSSECNPGAFSRGSRYFRDHRARLRKAQSSAGGELLLLGECDGSRFEPYEQRVEIIDARGEPALSGFCTCPVGYNCKHVVALVLTWQALGSHAGPPHERTEQWLAELESDAEVRSDARKAESLLYLLAPARAAEDDFNVEFVIARRKSDGEWGKGRSTQLSTLTHPWQRGSYLRPIDEEIVGFLELCNKHGWAHGCQLTGPAGYFALMKMAESGRLFLGAERRGPLAPGAERSLTVSWAKTAGHYRPRFKVTPEAIALALVPACYMDQERLEVGRLELPEGLSDERLAWLRRAPQVEAGRAAELSRRLALSAPGVPTPHKVEIEPVDGPPVACLRVEFEPDQPARAAAWLTHDYAGLRVAPHHDGLVVTGETGKRLVRARRDLAAEQRARERLLASGLKASADNSFAMPASAAAGSVRDTWLRWWEVQAPQLEFEGWRIERAESSTFRLSRADGIDGKVESDGGDWFSLRFDLEFDGWRMPLVPLITQLLDHYRPGELPETLYLDAGEGHFVSVPAAQIEPVLETVVELFDRIDHDQLQLARPDATRLLDLEGIPIKGATSLRNLARKLADFSGLKTIKPPTTFTGNLRPYQRHGLDWLQFLREHNFGGILADDMGLGKTVQTLAHLAVEKRAGRIAEPCLIVAPTSLMGNWRREAELFTPRLNVLVLHGSQRSEWFDWIGEYDLVLTTYPLLPRDRSVLLKQRWHYLILDEAQQIKNPKSQAAQVVRKLDCNHRLCLTGTPIENHLGELWAQFDFLMPGFLGDSEHFTRTFRTPIEKHNDGERLQSLNRRTAPFLLRRSKDRVAAELPPKTELLRTTRFDAKQARLYESIRLTMEKKVQQAIAVKGLARSHIIVLEALLKLRQVCCDPRLLPDRTRGASGVPSAKFELLFEILPEMLEEGRRVLLFSQFTTMLGLIEREVERRGITYAKLTGQTRKRDQAIDRFRSGQADLFLISLKAGGVGLNLVEADTVIHYDPWWNPAVEHQATDRAHRIGQDKPVFVYKLVAEGTVEEKILALQQHKQKLAEGVYGKERAQDQPPIDEKTIQALLSAD